MISQVLRQRMLLKQNIRMFSKEVKRRKPNKKNDFNMDQMKVFVQTLPHFGLAAALISTTGSSYTIILPVLTSFFHIRYMLASNTKMEKELVSKSQDKPFMHCIQHLKQTLIKNKQLRPYIEQENVTLRSLSESKHIRIENPVFEEMDG